MDITSLSELKLMAEGDVIELPGFKQGMPLRVRVRRASLLGLIRKGVLPNTLLSAAEELFYGKKASKPVDMGQLTKVMTTMAEHILLQPTIEDIKSVGLELTDEQIVKLFNYSQEGIKDVIPSDTESKDSDNTGHEQTVQSKTKPDTKSE